MTAAALRSPPRLGMPWWLSIALLFSMAVVAQQMGPKIIVTAEQVAQAVAASPLSPVLKQYATDIGRLAINVESGGNLGIYNGTCCTGVLQVNRGGLDRYCKCRPEQYANMSLQQQVNFWAEITNANADNAVIRSLMSMGTFGGRAVDGAMVLSCIQIGPGNCARTLRAGTCATGAGADGNGNNFCDFADRIRGGAAAGGNPSHPSSPPVSAPPAKAWTPASAPAAFAVGAGADMDEVRGAVQEIVYTALLLWVAWVAQAQFFSWRSGRTSLLAVESNVAGATVLAMLVVFIMLA